MGPLLPFYPHGGIPVPLSEGYTTASVEGAWQALKVFEATDVDLSKMRVADMKGLKRSERSFGRVRGHRAGVGSPRLLSYLEARQQLYLPLYRWVLEHRVADLVARLRAMNSQGMIVLLDYQTNGDVADLSSPLSHAALIKAFVEDRWPG